jgi:hypothetical protein
MQVVDLATVLIRVTGLVSRSSSEHVLSAICNRVDYTHWTTEAHEPSDGERYQRACRLSDPISPVRILPNATQSPIALLCGKTFKRH